MCLVIRKTLFAYDYIKCSQLLARVTEVNPNYIQCVRSIDYDKNWPPLC